MSYPPPPGGGWPGGDPNQPPMHDPYGGQPPQDPYGQSPYGPPQQDPYGQPQDPYGMPPQDPYGMPPQDPYAAQQYSAPGYGPPVSAMPGPPNAPQQNNNAGWIVGGVVGVVVIALAVVGTLFATGAFSSDDDDSSENTSDNSNSEDDDDDDNGGGDESGDGYAYQEGYCDGYQPDALLTETTEESVSDLSYAGSYEADGTISCNIDYSSGTATAYFWLTATIVEPGNESTVESTYSDEVSSMTGTPSEASGNWEEGSKSDNSSGDTWLDYFVVVRDENIVVSLNVWSSSVDELPFEAADASGGVETNVEGILDDLRI